MKNIKPDIDLQNSIERSRITESREYYKGKSFNFAKEWHPGINYFNDNYITDFVSYKGTLLVCRRTHLSSNSNRPELLFEDPKDSNQPTGVKSEYWDFILAGTPGPGGKVYIPNYNTSTGELSWVISDNIESIDPVNIKGEDGKDGRDGKDGKNGTNGKDGDTYVPQSELDNNYIVFKSLQGKETIKVDCSNLKGEPGERGEKGNDWVFSKVNTITLSPNDKGYADISADTPGSESTTYTLTLGIPQGKTGLKGNKGEKGEKGDQGEKGEAGPTPLFKLIRNESTRSIDLYWSIDEDSDWVNLGSVGGKSPKLLRVFDVAEHPNVQNSTRRDDRIVWGYDGISVSEWTTLCYLDELRGAENIWISTKEIKPGEGNPPVMEVRDPNNPEEIIQVEDKDKIWYDPFDISLDEFSSFEFVFNAYKEAGGQLSEDAFRNTFAKVDLSSYYTKIEVDNKVSAAVGSVYKMKGSVDDATALQALTGVAIGDTYNVIAAGSLNGEPFEAGSNFVAIKAGAGNQEGMWDKLGGTIDLSAYARSADVANTYATKTAVTSEIATKIGTLDKADTAVEGQVVSAVSETDGIITVSRRALVAGDIPTLATSKISGLDTALNGKVPTTRTVNSKSLSADVVLAGTDILVGGDGTYSTNNLQEAIEAIDGRIVQAAASGVQSFGGKTGAITVRGGQAATAPAVNLTMSDNELQAAVIGVATAAQGAKADTALQSSSITSGSVNGTIAVKGSNVFVKGLGSSAYTETSAFDAAGSADSALKSAKEYADNLMVWAEFN